MNLEITCKGIANASIMSGDLEITLQDVSPDFIEQLMNELDYNELVDYLENKYDVKVNDLSKEVLWKKKI